MRSPKPERQDLSQREEVLHLEAMADQVIAAGEYEELHWNYTKIAPQYREEVKDTAVSIHRSQRRMVEDYIAIGLELKRVQDYFPHGFFLGWVSVEFGMSQASAYDFINMATKYGSGNFEGVEKLGLSVARLLAQPQVPDAAVMEVIEKQENSTRMITITEARQVRDKHIATPKPRHSRVDMPSRLREPSPVMINEKEASYTREGEWPETGLETDVIVSPATLIDDEVTQPSKAAVDTPEDEHDSLLDDLVEMLVTLGSDDPRLSMYVRYATREQLADAIALLPEDDTARRPILLWEAKKRDRLGHEAPSAVVGVLMWRKAADRLSLAILSGALKPYMDQVDVDRLLISISRALNS